MTIEKAMNDALDLAIKELDNYKTVQVDYDPIMEYNPQEDAASTFNEIKAVRDALAVAKLYSLEAEVMWQFSQYIAAGDTINEALESALDDWDL